MKIFAKATAPAPKPTPAAIAAGVRKSRQLELAEIELRRLRELRQGIQDRAFAIINGTPMEGEPPEAAERRRAQTPDMAAINRLERERLAVEEKINTARRELQPLRQAHAEALARELGPMVNAEARRALIALADLRDAVRIIDQAQKQIALYGLDIGRPHLPETGALEDLLRRRAGPAATLAEAAE